MLLVVIKKELTRIFTDRRLIFTAFVVPAVGIYIMYTLMGNMASSLENDIDEHKSQITVVNTSESFEAYVKGAEEQFNMEVAFADIGELESLKEQLKMAEIDTIIVFEDGFDNAVSTYEGGAHPDIDTFFNPGEEYSLSAHSKVKYSVLSSYESMLLSERFGGMERLTAFTLNIDNEDNGIAEEGKEAGLGMSMILPLILNIMLFSAAMSIGMDVIAGEKERGTMATMLLAPVDRSTIALGKVISLGIVATISATITCGAVILSLPNLTSSMGGDAMTFEGLAFGAADFAMLFGILITQVGIFVGMICLLSVIAKNMKEAGTIITPLYLVVMFIAFASMFLQGDHPLYRFAIPIFGNVISVKELLTSDLTAPEFFTSVGVSLVVVIVLVRLVTMAFNNEKVMFNS